MLQIDDSVPPEITTCECCGGRTYWITRPIIQNDSPIGLCQFSFTDNHRDHFVTFALSLGDWTRDAPETRRCFTIWYEHTPEHRGYMLRDGLDNVRNGAKVLGRMLSREEALHDPEVGIAWEVTDILFLYDPVLAPYLAV